jgi:peptide deformylase
MSKLDIVLHPDPILRKICEPVAEVTPQIKQLMDDMLETMYAAPGIGLAAPQVGVLKRVIVMDLEAKDDKPGRPIKMVNPEIISFSAEQTLLEEGCLSLPEMNCDVIRPEKVTAKYLDENGVEQTIEADGLLAKCIQHEVDHLNGRLIFDYLSPLKRNMALRKYNKLMKNG